MRSAPSQRQPLKIEPRRASPMGRLSTAGRAFFSSAFRSSARAASSVERAGQSSIYLQTLGLHTYSLHALHWPTALHVRKPWQPQPDVPHGQQVWAPVVVA